VNKKTATEATVAFRTKYTVQIAAAAAQGVSGLELQKYMYEKLTTSSLSHDFLTAWQIEPDLHDTSAAQKIASKHIKISLKRAASAQGEQDSEVDAALAAGTVSHTAVGKLKEAPAADFNAAFLKVKRQKRTGIAYTQRLSDKGVQEISKPSVMAYVRAGEACEQRLSKGGVSEEIQEMVDSGTICKATAMGYVHEGNLYATGALTMPAEIQHPAAARHPPDYQVRGSGPRTQ
jgi:hypothetical protein